uniref:Uncharacterized protein n=1 Tax=Setaria viridis TaxID=4556 RepID=A0A4U6U5T3_SETVI|nr:hypothetical protein SEVIR_6G156150v2 [Setaria viridis]
MVLLWIVPSAVCIIALRQVNVAVEFQREAKS